MVMFLGHCGKHIGHDSFKGILANTFSMTDLSFWCCYFESSLKLHLKLVFSASIFSMVFAEGGSFAICNNCTTGTYRLAYTVDDVIILIFHVYIQTS